MEEVKLKAQFFAQYLGQQVLNGNIYVDGEWIDECLIEHSQDTCPSFLLLRTVEQLTLGDAKTICYLANLDWNKNTDFYVYLWQGGQFIEYLFKCRPLYFNESQLIRDYLISMGYLLPFNYLTTEIKPITLHPAELISMGWAKIKSDPTY